MASGGKKARAVPLDLFDCQVCLEPMVERQPRTLPACNHTFCQECLEKLFDWQFKSIVCPICRKLTIVPKSTVTSLPQNLTLAKMKEWQTHILKETANVNVQVCEICCHDGTFEDASNKCNECNINLCDSCAGIHLSTPAFAGHHITQETDSRQPRCHIHGKPIGLVCLECQKGICLICSFGDVHQKHKEQILSWDQALPRITELVQNQQDMLQKDLDELEMVLQRSVEDLQRVDGVLQELAFKEKEIRDKIEAINKDHKVPRMRLIRKLQLAKEKYIKNLNVTHNRDTLDYFLNEPKLLKEIEDAKTLVHEAYDDYDHVPKLNTDDRDPENTDTSQHVAPFVDIKPGLQCRRTGINIASAFVVSKFVIVILIVLTVLTGFAR